MSRHTGAGVSAGSSSKRILQLLQKTTAYDKDERFMATSDLCTELANMDEAATTRGGTATGGASSATAPVLESSVQQSLGKSILQLLEDSSPDVQSVAVKTLSMLCTRLGSEHLLSIVDKLCKLVCDPSKKESRDIYAIGIKTMIGSCSGGSGGAAVGQQAPTPTTAQSQAQLALGSVMSQRIVQGMLTGLAPLKSASNEDELDVLNTVLDILKEVLSQFGSAVGELHESLLQQLTPHLESGQEVIRKRVINTLAALVPTLSDALFKTFMDGIVDTLHQKQQEAQTTATPANAARNKQSNSMLYTYLQMIGVVSTRSGPRIGPYLHAIVPQLEKLLTLPENAATGGSGSEMAIELSEHSLAAFESLIQFCPQEFAPYLPRILQAAQQFMSWDPNYVYAEDDETETGGDGDTAMDVSTKAAIPTSTGDEEEDEGDWGAADDNEGDEGWGDEDGADGEEDEMDDLAEDESNTWRLRRAAVKVLSAFIRSKATINVAVEGSASEAPVDLLVQNYAQLCDALLDRFKERDINVRVVVLQAMEDLLRESGSATTAAAGMGQESAVSQHFHAHQGVSAILETKAPAILNACIKQLKQTSNAASASHSSGATLETKHHLFLILTELLLVRGGGLDAYLQKLIPLLLIHLSPSQPAGVKMDAISLLRTCIDLHPPSSWFGSLNGAHAASQLSSIVTTLDQSLVDTNYKFRSEVLQTAASIVVLLGQFKHTQTDVGMTTPLYEQVITKDLLTTLYRIVFTTLQLSDVQQELKEAALGALAHLFYYFGGELQQQGQAEGLDRLRDCLSIVLHLRLSNELTRLASLRCLTRLSHAPAAAGLNVVQYVLGGVGVGGESSKVLEELISFLKKDSQVLQLEAAQTLLGLLHNMELHKDSRSNQEGSLLTSWSETQVSNLMREAALHITEGDLNLSSLLLQLFQRLFRLLPQRTVYASSTQAVADVDLLLSKVLLFLRSPLLQAQNLDEVRLLFYTIMQLNYPNGQGAHASINPHLTFKFLFELLMGSFTEPQASGSQTTAAAASTASSVATPAYLSNLSQVIGSGLLLPIPAADQGAVLQQLVALVSASQSSSDSRKQLALLILGEFGQHVFHPSLTDTLFFSCFGSPNEAVRQAASLAFGRVILGNVGHYLPTLLQQMQATQGAQQKEAMLLLLNSLRELITQINTASSAQPATSFRPFLPTLLPLLWQQAEDGEESIRSLVSEVLGGLLLIDGAATWPDLVRLMASPKPHIRTVVITALRHSLTQQQQAAAQAGAVSTHPAVRAELLAQHIPTFLNLLRDPDLVVRRQAILTVNALAHSKGGMALLLPSFQSVILPTLYQHLTPDPSLVRVVDMGPFKHKVDDGYPLRKASYQTFDTLVDVCFPLLDSATLIRHLGAGLSDQDDIILLVYQILHKIALEHPFQLSRVLDELPQKMMDGIKEKLKLAKTPPSTDGSSSSASVATTERAKDVLRTAVRCLVTIAHMPHVSSCPQFCELYQRVLKTQMLARMIEEMKQTN